MWSRPSSRSSKKPRELNEKTALGVALRLVKTRPRSSMELAVRLREKGYTDSRVNSVIEQLTSVKILDDERFAADWARFRDRLRPSGTWLLRQELRDKGIHDKLIATTIDQRETSTWFENIGLVWDGRPIERHLAEQVAGQWAKKTKRLPEEKRKARVLHALERRGFAADAAWAAIKITVGGDYIDE